MENETNNQNLAPNPNYPTEPINPREDPLQKLAKYTLIVFVASLILLAVLGIIDIWGNFSSGSSDVFPKLEGTLGILTAASFLLSIGLRIFRVRKK